MERVFPVMGTVFLKFQFFLDITPVFAGGIVAPFAFGTLQGNQFHSRLFTRHNKPLFNISRP
jgi:hypothetical protein